MKTPHPLERETFEMLLNWLSPERVSAGEKYEQIRRTLINIFSWNGLADPEDLADETINRVAHKLPEVTPHYVGDPALFFYGVARNVIKQQTRKQTSALEDFDPRVVMSIEEESADDTYDCLQLCLDELPAVSREVVIGYYAREKGAKIQYRREMARRMAVSNETLRVRVHRIREALKRCIEQCLENVSK